MLQRGNPLSQATTAKVTVLEMRGQTTLVILLAGTQMLFYTEFALGVDALIRQSLRHEPPLPIELEHAIELTEEAGMPLAPQFSGSAGLILKGLAASLITCSLRISGIKKPHSH